MRRPPARARRLDRSVLPTLERTLELRSAVLLFQVVERLHPRHERRANPLEHRTKLRVGTLVRMDAYVERARQLDELHGVDRHALEHETAGRTARDLRLRQPLPGQDFE